MLNMKLSGLWSVMLLLCTDLVRFGVSHPKPACRYPPSQWCRSLEIAIECRVQKQCMEMNAIRPNQTVPPVSVILYYESLCPASRVFMSQQLFPTWTMLRDIMAVTLVPYGNAKELRSANSPFTCQHGEPECRGNMIEACIIHLTGHLAFHIIYCMESAANVLNAAEPCLQVYAPSASWSSVDSCVKGGLGYRLMHTNAVMTRALNPVPTHIPWVTFNGQVFIESNLLSGPINKWAADHATWEQKPIHWPDYQHNFTLVKTEEMAIQEYIEDNVHRAMSSLFHLVCQLYKGVKPPACTGAPVRLDRSFC